MFVVQGDRAVNIDCCCKIYVCRDEVKGLVSEVKTVIAKFDTEEQAQECLSLILKAYAHGDKVFYC